MDRRELRESVRRLEQVPNEAVHSRRGGQSRELARERVRRTREGACTIRRGDAPPNDRRLRRGLTGFAAAGRSNGEKGWRRRHGDEERLEERHARLFVGHRTPVEPTGDWQEQALGGDQGA